MEESMSSYIEGIKTYPSWVEELLELLEFDLLLFLVELCELPDFSLVAADTSPSNVGIWNVNNFLNRHFNTSEFITEL